MSAVLLGSYVPADTVLHRLPAGAKLFGLVAASIAIVVARGPVSGVVALAVALLCVLWARIPLRQTVRTLRLLLLAAVLLSAWNLWQGNWARAFEQATDLVALVLLATVLTATTTIDDLVDVIVRMLEPLRRFGVKPEMVALAFSMVLRTIPILFTLAAETRDAARARGLERNPRAWLTPFVIRSVAHAVDSGEALQARGIGDD